MREAIGSVLVLALAVVVGLSVAATTIGMCLGLEPTGLLMINALTETPLSEAVDLRAEAGIATDDIEGLMLVTVTMLYHQTIEFVDPFLGAGLGVALTPPPFSTGFVVEGAGGIRVNPSEMFSLFVQVRYIARWSQAGWTTGPLYEAGVALRF